jgi:hypothetical protein
MTNNNDDMFQAETGLDDDDDDDGEHSLLSTFYPAKSHYMADLLLLSFAHTSSRRFPLRPVTSEGHNSRGLLGA